VGLGGATLFNAQLGQTGAFAAAFALLYVLAYPRSHAWAGFFLGLLAFKPQYALFLAAWPLAARHVRVLLVAVVTVIASTVVSGAAFGWERIREFGAAVVTPNATAPNMANWFSLIHPPSPVAAMCVALGAFLALLGLCVYAHRRGAAMLGVAGISTAVALVASPNTHPYDLILWMLPLLALTRRSRYPGALILVPMVAAYPFIRPDLRFVLALASLALVILTARQLRDEFTQLAPAPRRSGA
jgi:hypothetical protein